MKSKRMAYVDKIAPKHCRTSCSDKGLANAAESANDYDGMGRCYRCTLLRAATVGCDVKQDDSK